VKTALLVDANDPAFALILWSRMTFWKYMCAPFCIPLMLS